MESPQERREEMHRRKEHGANRGARGSQRTRTAYKTHGIHKKHVAHKERTQENHERRAPYKHRKAVRQGATHESSIGGQPAKHRMYRHRLKHPLSKTAYEDREARKGRVLTQGTPSVVRSTANAVTAKDENLFLVSMPDGDIPSSTDHGFGLYYNDCRYLNTYQMRVSNTKLNGLVATGAQGFKTLFELTNMDLKENHSFVPKDTIGVRSERFVDCATGTMQDQIALHNYGPKDVKFTLQFKFNADFEDVFEVRGLMPPQNRPESPTWNKNSLQFCCEGVDNYVRLLKIEFSDPPQKRGLQDAEFEICLGPEETRNFYVIMHVAEVNRGDEHLTIIERTGQKVPRPRAMISEEANATREWFSHQTEFKTDSLVLHTVIERSLLDLHVLRSSITGDNFISAGVPWYATLFGRDSLITAYELLGYNPALARETLELLAAKQATSFDDWRDAEPGKILHELRRGELARAGEIPQSPYYGTVDATPLFLILIHEYVRWTGDLDLFKRLLPNVERALTWINVYGDHNHDGYVDYESHSKHGLINQGWKDSGDGIVASSGRLAIPPITLVEVQAYVIAAKLGIAELYRASGDEGLADQLEREAKELKRRFNRDFWCARHKIFGLGLEKRGRLLEVVSSNPGHALWTGAAEKGKAHSTIKRLMKDDMFNGWGIRTLSEREHRYNPIGYHLGTVWPHDNAIIAAGMRRYGHDLEALMIFQGLIEAALQFRDERLPEVFAGFSRLDFKVPVTYPVACAPQAWAAGALPFLLQTILGVRPNALKNELHLVRPILPEFVGWVELKGLRVGHSVLDLRFECQGKHVAGKVTHQQGKIRVIHDTQW